MRQQLDQRGQAMIEALVAGSLGLIGLYFVFIIGIKILNSALEAEKTEESYICILSNKNGCSK